MCSLSTCVLVYLSTCVLVYLCTCVPAYFLILEIKKAATMDDPSLSYLRLRVLFTFLLAYRFRGLEDDLTLLFIDIH